MKLGCEVAFKKTNPKKKFVSLNRTEQADYLISVLSPKDAVLAPVNEVTQSEMVELCPLAAQELTDDKRLFESWCDGTGFSTTFLPSVVPYSRLYMWLRVLLTSRSLLAYLATLCMQSFTPLQAHPLFLVVN